MTRINLQQRRAGILLHPTSLPSGTLSEDVERWLDILAASGFSVWQVLPLGEPQTGLSPYQCTSAFALNPALLPVPDQVDESDNGFDLFCKQQQYWLEDYALFKVMKQHFNQMAWTQWPHELKFRESAALESARHEHHITIQKIKWQQYCLHKRWHEIRAYAASKGIILFGDMPIFIAHDSADVWSSPDLFLLDEQGEMEVVSGVPPDYFSETGQRWGNPHYNWDRMRENEFAWWQSRIYHHLELFDIVRIDHFRGLEASWVIDAASETAVNGYWKAIPGDELLAGIQNNIDDCHDQLPFVAEDLGVITPEVTALRKKYRLPGMSILQFGFDEFDDNPHKPKNIEPDTVVYTGTHDNDTTKGWFNSLEEHVKNHVLDVLGLSHVIVDQYQERLKESCWYEKHGIADYVVEKMVDNAMHSNANLCIIPVQDCLHLGTDARMNVPGTIEGNWEWRFTWEQIEPQGDVSHLKIMFERNLSAGRVCTDNTTGNSANDESGDVNSNTG